jgi:hypothetical protein
MKTPKKSNEEKARALEARASKEANAGFQAVADRLRKEALKLRRKG